MIATVLATKESQAPWGSALPWWFSLGQNGVTPLTVPHPLTYRDKIFLCSAQDFMKFWAVGMGQSHLQNDEPEEAESSMPLEMGAHHGHAEPWLHPRTGAILSVWQPYMQGLVLSGHSVGIWELTERSCLCQDFEGCVAINSKWKSPLWEMRVSYSHQIQHPW